LRVFEDRVLTKLIGAQTQEITRSCRKLQNDEFHKL